MNGILHLSTDESEKAIQSFCEFLTFETVSNTAVDSGAYKACAAWLFSQLETIPVLKSWQLPESPEGSPVVVACWKGKDESLPILLLNGHYDVVPAEASDWSVAPFEGIRKAGRIYGRGTQDMKCVCMQYIEAIRKIHAVYPEWQPERSIYLTFVPDEEVGGAGMAAFLDSDLYRSLPGIALALDEGLASTSPTFAVFYGERVPWFVNVKATGPTGHGSRFIDNTAVEQIIDLCNKALAFRENQRALLMGHQHTHANCAHAVVAKKIQEMNGRQGSIKQGEMSLGDVTSLNVTTLQAGVKSGNTFAFNCVPPTAECSLDIRITPHTDPKEIGNMLNQWCQECSKTDAPLEWSYIGNGHDAQEHSLTSTDRSTNPWYNVFASTLDGLGYSIEPSVFPAATDSRFLRALGIRALGFSPMRSTEKVPIEIKLHEIDEYIPEATFIEGISVYVGLVKALASQGKELE